MNVLYPGSFDPITKGHMYIITKASELFDHIIIAILINPNKKNSLFTPLERLSMIKELYANNPKITVITSTKTAVDVALENNCHAIIRGLRNTIDFDYEYQTAIVNQELSDNQITTICLFTEPQYQHVSSSMVKQVLNLNKPIDKYIDPKILKKILTKGDK